MYMGARSFPDLGQATFHQMLQSSVLRLISRNGKLSSKLFCKLESSGLDNCATMRKLRALLPILDWGGDYQREDFRADIIAGVVVLFITVPQTIAYAFLAGLPPEAGLYASLGALMAYAAFGSSRTLAVGPTAIILSLIHI